MQRSYDWTRLWDAQKLMAWSATLIRSSVGEETFRKTRVENAEPAHNTCFLGGSATNRFIITPARPGNELEWSEPPQPFRV